MMKQLLNQVLADGDYFATTGAGTSAVNGATVDMNGYEGVLFIAKFGTAAANNTIKAQQGAESDLSDAADLVGTSVAVDGSTKYVVHDLFKPKERYVRAVASRGTSSTLDGGVAIRYGARTLPPTNTNAEAHVSPVEGTA